MGTWVLGGCGGAPVRPIETMRLKARDGVQCVAFSHPRPRLRIEEKTRRWGRGIYDYHAGPGAHELLTLSRLDGRTKTLPHETSASDFLCMLEVARARVAALQDALTETEQFMLYSVASEMSVPVAQLLMLPRRTGRCASIDEHARRHYDAKSRCVTCDAVSYARENGQAVYDGYAITVWAGAPGAYVSVAPNEHVQCFRDARREDLTEVAVTLAALARYAHAQYGSRYRMFWAVYEHGRSVPGEARHWSIIANAMPALPLESEFAQWLYGVDTADATTVIDPHSLRDEIASVYADEGRRLSP